MRPYSNDSTAPAPQSLLLNTILKENATLRKRVACRSSDADTAAAAAGVGTGHQTHPGRRRCDAVGRLEDRERVVDAVEIGLADAGVVVQVVPEVAVAVAHVVDAVEHVRVPDLVDVRRGGDLLLGERLAQLQETAVLELRGAEPVVGPVGVVTLHARHHATELEVGQGCQGTGAHMKPHSF